MIILLFEQRDSNHQRWRSYEMILEAVFGVIFAVKFFSFLFQTYNNHSTIAEDFSVPNTLWKKSVVIPLHIYSNHLQASSLFVSSFDSLKYSYFDWISSQLPTITTKVNRRGCHLCQPLDSQVPPLTEGGISKFHSHKSANNICIWLNHDGARDNSFN